jgi:hypothetical protein
MRGKILWFRLPQTLIRALAFEDIDSIDLLQTPFKDKYFDRHGNYTEASLKISKTVKETFFHNSNHFFSDQVNVSQILDQYEEIIIDLNLVLSFDISDVITKFKNRISVIDYASGSYSPVLSDLATRNFIPLFVALKRSLALSQKIRPSIFYDWTGTVTHTRGGYVPWFWRSKSMAFPILKIRTKILLEKFADIDVNVEQFYLSNFPILLLPWDLPNKRQIEDFVLNQSRVFEELWKHPRTFGEKLNVFIKPHRSVDMDSYKDKDWNTRTININFMSTPLAHLLPSEVLIHSTDKLKLFSIIGSSVFGVPANQLERLNSPQSKLETRSYALATARSRRLFIEKASIFPW